MNPSRHFLQNLPEWEKLPVSFFSDETENSPIPACHPMSQLIKIRTRLKEFCLINKIRMPEYCSSERFEKISSWAVKKNSFPMVLKTEENLNDGNLVFLLKAFRELPEFHELISQKKSGVLMIEDFAHSKAYIEVTTTAGKIKLISQFSIERSMRMRHCWRAFPINLPQTLNKKITDIIARFPQLETLPDIPIRFSFALTSPEITLLSVNSGLTRPEYNPSWCHKAGIPMLFDNQSPAKNIRLNKILCFYTDPPIENCEEELKKHCGSTLVNYFSHKDQTLIMLGHENPSRLQEFSRWISGIFMQTNDSPIPPGSEQ